MKEYAARFPFLFALGSVLAAMLCLVLPTWIPEFSLAEQMVIGRVTICLFAILLLIYLGWWRETGFVRPRNWRILLPYLPIIILLLAVKIFDSLTVGIYIRGLQMVMLGFFVYIAGGFMEEAVFRGLVLRTLLPGGLLRAAFLSALLFALAHLLNLLMGANVNATLLQVLQVEVAFLAGLCFCAPLAVTRNIWPLVVLHGLNNVVGYLNAGGFLNTAATSKGPTWLDASGSLLPFALLSMYSIWLLWRTKRQGIKRSALTPSLG